MKTIPLVIALCALLGACSLRPKPLTFEEAQLQTASQQCQNEATSMNPEWPTSSNPLWSSYFSTCMHGFGYTDEQINKLWY